MKPSLRHLASVACVLALLVCATTGWSEKLDGTKWKIKASPNKTATERGEKGFDDQLAFADDQFSSSFSGGLGFSAAKYIFEDEGYEFEWEAKQTSEKNGKLFWSGGIVKEALKGKLEWHRIDGTVVRYNFEGKKL
jgi:hypothetical protein